MRGFSRGTTSSVRSLGASGAMRCRGLPACTRSARVRSSRPAHFDGMGQTRPLAATGAVLRQGSRRAFRPAEIGVTLMEAWFGAGQRAASIGRPARAAALGRGPWSGPSTPQAAGRGARGTLSFRPEGQGLRAAGSRSPAPRLRPAARHERALARPDRRRRRGAGDARARGGGAPGAGRDRVRRARHLAMLPAAHPAERRPWRSPFAESSIDLAGGARAAGRGAGDGRSVLVRPAKWLRGVLAPARSGSGPPRPPSRSPPPSSAGALEDCLCRTVHGRPVEAIVADWPRGAGTDPLGGRRVPRRDRRLSARGPDTARARSTSSSISAARPSGGAKAGRRGSPSRMWRP